MTAPSTHAPALRSELTARPEEAVRLDAKIPERPSSPRSRQWDARIWPRLPGLLDVIVAVGLAAMIAAVDLSRGPFVDLGIFYVIPIFMAAWTRGPWLAVPIALLALVSSHHTENALRGEFDGRFTLRHLIFQDAAHGAMYFLLVWATLWVKGQGDLLEAEHDRVVDAQERLNADLEAARRVQQALMQQALPDTPRLATATAYRFARQVGGDLIDVRRRGARVAICVADVSGKGAQAALMAAAVRGWLDYLRSRFVSPAEVAEQLNNRLCECVPVELFVTLAYLIVDTNSGEVRATVAGHEPPLIYRPASGQVEQLPPCGPALGLLPGASYTSLRYRLAEDDLLLVYTDGLTTARLPDGRRTGLDPTISLLRAGRGQDLSRLVEEILATAVPRDADPIDDVALVAARWRPRHSARRETQ